MTVRQDLAIHHSWMRMTHIALFPLTSAAWVTQRLKGGRGSQIAAPYILIYIAINQHSQVWDEHVQEIRRKSAEESCHKEVLQSRTAFIYSTR